VANDIDRIALQRLRRDGQRYTDNRRRLVALLATSEAPLTIPEILAGHPDLAQSSVYRNLAVLERAGLVHRIVTTDDWARYELDHTLTHHHHHLICSTCGVVRDFTVSPRLERSIDDALAKVASAAGFHLEHHRLDLLGQCEECAAS
jgi:Fe2+ or Zn2+ uptake regulation protein